MEKIENKQFDQERALYNINNTTVLNCEIKGEADGESALKECSNIIVDSSLLDLRYPLWHCDVVKITNSTMTENCRAALWYTHNVDINKSSLGGIKALRECSNINIINSTINSPEFGWKSDKIDIENTKIISEYAFFEGTNITLNRINFAGKYAFQYIKNMSIKDSVLKTKDAFWHTENVTVTDSLLEGEYLGWYSENLTLVRCHIRGTQPLCYCKNLKLIDCTMAETDLAFELSDVNATVNGNIVSVKNPLSGEIIADSIGETIFDSKKYKCEGKVTIRK